MITTSLSKKMLERELVFLIKNIRRGATLVTNKEEVWGEASMIVKVKEPLGPGLSIMKSNQVLFTYLHLAADQKLTDKLMKRGIIGIAYETVQERDGSLLLLRPMSEIAGGFGLRRGVVSGGQAWRKSALIPGAKTPKLVTREMLKKMRPGSEIVDISVDQGECFETTRTTTHENPPFVEKGIVHYCVANIPGAYPRTAAPAPTNATFPYVLQITDKGYEQAFAENEVLRKDLNVIDSKVVCQGVAEAFGLACTANPFERMSRSSTSA